MQFKSTLPMWPTLREQARMPDDEMQELVRTIFVPQLTDDLNWPVPHRAVPPHVKMLIDSLFADPHTPLEEKMMGLEGPLGDRLAAKLMDMRGVEYVYSTRSWLTNGLNHVFAFGSFTTMQIDTPAKEASDDQPIVLMREKA